MNLCQFFTPAWVAEALVERHFPKLDAADVVLEPSCGPGAFLRAVPAGVPAIGVDIDPLIVQVAREQTGREVIAGDFRTVDIPVRPSAIIGNPPFVAGVFDGFLDRARQLLADLLAVLTTGQAAGNVVGLALHPGSQGRDLALELFFDQLPGCTWEGYMRMAIPQMLKCDMVALLPGWRESRGAFLEVTIAGQLGMPMQSAASISAGPVA